MNVACQRLNQLVVVSRVSGGSVRGCLLRSGRLPGHYGNTILRSCYFPQFNTHPTNYVYQLLENSNDSKKGAIMQLQGHDRFVDLGNISCSPKGNSCLLFPVYLYNFTPIPPQLTDACTLHNITATYPGIFQTTVHVYTSQ